MRVWADRGTVSGRCRAVALALPLALAGVPGADAVTLEEAVRAAIKTNPDIGAVVENRRAVDFELSQARAGFLPTFDLNASSGKEFVNNSTTRGRQLDGDDSRTTSLPTTTFGFTIRQLLFDGFDTLSQVERQEARVRSAARRVRETGEFISQDAAEAYLESLRQRELIRISEQNVRAHEVFLELVRARVAGGAAGRAEEEQAQQRLAGARDAVTQADGLRRDADARYRRIVGEEPIEMSRPVVPVGALPTTVNQAIELAIQFNPTVRVSRSDIEVAEAELKQTKSSYWPQLSFEVTGNTNRNSGGTRGQDSTVSALLVMNYNLYRGGADIARRSEFLARLAEARQRLAQSQRATDENTRVAWNALENIRDRIKQLEAIVKANQAIRDSFKKEFDVGRRDLLDLLNAENDYFQAKGTLVSNQFVEMLGVYRLLGATGLLMAALDVEQAKESFLSEAESASFNSELQQYVEATPVLNFQGAGTPIGAPGHSGAPLAPPLVPGGPAINPLAPIQGSGAPGVDLLSPVGPVLDPNAPAVPGGAVLDPNAPISGGDVLDPTLPLPNATAPAVPGGGCPGPDIAAHRSLFTRARSFGAGSQSCGAGPRCTPGASAHAAGHNQADIAIAAGTTGIRRPEDGRGAIYR